MTYVTTEIFEFKAFKKLGQYMMSKPVMKKKTGPQNIIIFPTVPRNSLKSGGVKPPKASMQIKLEIARERTPRIKMINFIYFFSN